MFEYPCLSVGFRADVLINIDSVMEKKAQSIRCFDAHIQANYAGNTDTYDSSILSPNRRWGLEAGCLYAEAYARIDVHEVHNKAVQYISV
jgi:hypothetical protein